MMEFEGFVAVGIEEAKENLVSHEIKLIKSRLFDVETYNATYIKIAQDIAEEIGMEIEIVKPQEIFLN